MADYDHVEQKKLLSELKSPERLDLCKILKQNDKWEDLAGFMNVNVSTICELRECENPMEELLVKLSHCNCTVDDLFLLLSKMHHYQSMKLLKPFVSKKHHHLIEDGKANMKKLYGLESSSPKDLKIGPQNFNEIQYTQINNQKVFGKLNDKELGAEKILNVSLQSSALTVPKKSDVILFSTASPCENNSLILQPVAGGSKINNDEEQFSMGQNTLSELHYEELTQATDNWSSDNILGKGSFGTVFSGKRERTKIVIKKIKQPGPEVIRNYIIQLKLLLQELKILNACKHDNILSLEGYSIGPEASCLVYQLMVNGSLEDCLLLKDSLRKRGEPLTWFQRHEIAKGTARGLQFLHTIGDKPIIHGDVRSANILLDKNYQPRIEGFGLTRQRPGNDSAKVSRIHRPRPDLSIELPHDKISLTKVDTYYFGEVLFELATGLPAYDDARPENKHLKELIENCQNEHLLFLEDQSAGTENRQVFENLIILGKWCSKMSDRDRPEMLEVFSKINEL